jgi:3',5'-cyclic AMP phosphodiesterase CpdA
MAPAITSKFRKYSQGLFSAKKPKTRGLPRYGKCCLKEKGSKQMKKVIHLSDVHIGCEGMYERFRDVIRHLAMIKQPAVNYVVVITGDIVDEASDENYSMAKECLDILTSGGYRVLIVPGNHDYGSGNCADKKWVKKFKKQFFSSDQVGYPKLDIIDGMAFIGLDSMEKELGTWDRRGANGELGKNQLNKLDAMLGSNKVHACEKTVIYLHHHPVDPIPQHELKDAKGLGKVVSKYKDSIQAVLFGHLHLGKKSNGWCGIERVYDAGATTMKDGAPGSHRVIDLAREPIYDYDADFHGKYASLPELPLIKTLLELLATRM